MEKLSRWPRRVMKVIRPTPRKVFYDEAKRIIQEAILNEKPTGEGEINIEEAYGRSTYTLGGYVTVDWNHIQDIKKIEENIIRYLYDGSLKRPLNIIMLAQPGSGKSYFIECLANKLDSWRISAVSFNMATMEHMGDLIQPLDAVRNFKIIDRLPILFIDEFDSNPSNYQLLLPLLWDGEIHVGHSDLKLGKVIIIIAGSDPKIIDVMKAAKNMKRNLSNGEDKIKKLVDLLSRINGGLLEIPELDLEKGDRDRRVDKICMTISLLEQRFGQDLQLVPWCLLRFIGFGKFRYGVRSLAHLIDIIPREARIYDRLFPEDLKLPLMSTKELKSSSLAYHLIADEDPEEIVEMWKDILENRMLVRFKTTEEPMG